ncbi:hypothetical protein BDB00DRAFT_821803 [Zychaea mexicana]|uniref:uncharacterized protein n=1 Tax=Zychaea mexicana TaxID=64656 RepID=UPI0022FDF180|nr:uncharacterized protein BDB00DRAFT_821803 [Zychaea mexicana]KAI9493842.1 hypothetical protein BDB00DRAFT_821803 [Zychaea mexicana]
MLSFQNAYTQRSHSTPLRNDLEDRTREPASNERDSPTMTSNGECTTQWQQHSEMLPILGTCISDVLSITRGYRDRGNKTTRSHSLPANSTYRPSELCIPQLNSQVDLRKSQWIHVLPYDILNLIFCQLSMHDFVVCLAVCRSWLSFIKDYPLFGQNALKEIPYFSTIPTTTAAFASVPSGSFFDFMLTQQSSMQEIHMVGQTKQAGATFLRLIMYSARNFKIRSLHLEEWEYDATGSESILYSLLRSLREYAILLEQVSLINAVDIPSIQYLGNVLFASKNAKRITLICNRWHRQQIATAKGCRKAMNDHDEEKGIEITHCVSHEALYHISTKSLPILSLTYLKLSLPDMYKHHYPFGGKAFPNIFPSCPNLQHLYMDSLDNIYHAQAIYEAFHYCRQLQHAIVSPFAEMPSGIEKDQDKDDVFAIKSDNEEQLPLRRLVFTQGNCSGSNPLRRYDLCHSGCLHSDSRHLVPVLKQYRHTLDLLYLQYDGDGKSTSSCVQHLGKCGGAPQLRELHIVAEGNILVGNNGDGYDDEKIYSQASFLFSNQLALLVSHCPSLRVLVITSANNASVSMAINGHLLQALANNCPLLRRLVIRGKHVEISAEALLDFAKATSAFSSLEYLDVSCYVHDDNIISLSNMFPLLKTLRLLKPHMLKGSLGNFESTV